MVCLTFPAQKTIVVTEKKRITQSTVPGTDALFEA